MCGRYASARKRIELLEEFSVQRDAVTEPLQPDYNVAPTKPVYAVLERSDARAPDASSADGAVEGSARPATATRELRVLRWGLVPFWAKDPKIGSRMINARVETVAEKPAFRHAFAKRRCLLPADGYYEWQARPDAAKQPVYISPRNGRPLALAGLYELWRDRAVASDDPDAWLWTATVITTSAPDELGVIHDRMPMIIDPDRWADWLDPAGADPADLRALLVPAAVSGLQVYPVSTQVNAVRNNGPQLIEPLAGPLIPVPAAPAAAGAQLRIAGIPSNGADSAQALF
jgi:putative SOS response-associated peptidase YedK